MATFTWLANTGDWGTVANWQPAGTPNNAADVAVIDAAGTYAATVEDDASYVVQSATLGASDATLQINGTLAIGNVLALNAGTLLLNVGGIVSGGSVELAGGSLVANGGTLDATTIVGDLTLGDDAALTVTGELIVQNATTGLPGTIALSGANALLTFGASQTLDSVSLQLTGLFAGVATPVGTLTLGAGVVAELASDFGLISGNVINLGTIRQTDGISALLSGAGPAGFVNQGLVTIEQSELDVDIQSFANSGIVRIGDGGRLQIAFGTTLTNTGTLAIEIGGTLGLHNDLTLAELNTFDVVSNDGTLQILGSLDLTGGTLALTQSGPFDNLMLSDPGVIFGGTILSDGGAFLARGGTLAGVTHVGPLVLDDGASLTTTGSFVVQGATAGSPGVISFGNATNLAIFGDLALGSAINPGTIEMSGANSVLRFDQGGTLDNVFLDFRGNYNVIESAATALTLGASLVTDLTGDDVEFQGNFVNQSTFKVNAGTTYIEDIDPLTTFANDATIVIGAASLFIDNDIFINSGLITVGTGGTLSVGALASLVNDGSITLAIDSTISRHDATTLAELSDGGIVNDGGTIQISGPLDLQGGTMDIAPGGLFGAVDITNEGTVSNGTIKLDGGYFSPGGGTFDAIIHRGAIELPDFDTLNAINGLTVTDQTGTLAGTIAIGTGSTISIEGGLTLAAGAGPGTIDLSNAFGALRLQNIGTLDGTDIVISGDQAQLFIDEGTLTLGPDTEVDLSSIVGYGYGSLINLGFIQQTAGFFDLLNVNEGDTFANSGSILVTNAEFLIDLAGFTNAGTVVVGAGGDFNIGSTTVFTSSGTFVIEGGGILDIAAPTEAAITFDGSGLLLLTSPDSYDGVLHNFGSGGQLELAGLSVTGASIAGTTLTANLEGGGSLSYLVDPGLDGTNLLVAEGGDGLLNRLVMPCFLAGTRLRTERGAVPVEDLREDDWVETISGNFRPVRWIGHRDVDVPRHPRPASVLPVRIQAQAFGPNLPERELFLSPDHAVLVDSVLIPIKHLINGTTVRQVQMAAVTYFHVELDRHDVVLAEGLAAESYLDTGDRANFANAGPMIRLHPDFGGPAPDTHQMWEAFGYAPLRIVGPEVDRARARLRDNAGRLAVPASRARRRRVKRNG